MGIGRRKVALHDAAGWVFNRMAHVYDARPPYPEALVAALCELVPAQARVVDIGAGIGHLSLPLAARGHHVCAVEPALSMLERLRDQVCGLPIEPLHGTAEALPLASDSVQLALVADALHFLDAERTGREIGRVLKAGGALAIVTCELADTPFMRGVVTLMEEAAPRRPRAVSAAHVQVATLAGAQLAHETSFADETPIDAQALEQILRSISFIGPAMNAERFAAFRARVLALPGEHAWARQFTLRAYRRAR